MQVLKKSQNQGQNDMFLDVHDIQSMLAQNEALSWLFSHFTGRDLQIDDSQNIELALDIGLDSDREFVQCLNEVKLPDLKSLKIINFLEWDDDVESLLGERLNNVESLHLAADGYWWDANDYLELVASIEGVKNLYLDGFLIDNENLERLMEHSGYESIGFFCWNLAIDEDFSLQFELDQENAANSTRSSKSVSTQAIEISSVRFILDESSTPDMKRFIHSVLKSPIQNSLKELSFFGCQISKASLYS